MSRNPSIIIESRNGKVKTRITKVKKLGYISWKKKGGRKGTDGNVGITIEFLSLELKREERESQRNCRRCKAPREILKRDNTLIQVNWEKKRGYRQGDRKKNHPNKPSEGLYYYRGLRERREANSTGQHQIRNTEGGKGKRGEEKGAKKI